MRLSFICLLILTGSSAISLHRIPISVEAERDLVGPVKRAPPSGVHGEPLDVHPEPPPPEDGPKFDFSDDGQYKAHLESLEQYKPKSYIVLGSSRLPEEYKQGDIGFFETTDEDGNPLIRIYPGKTISGGWNKFLAKYPSMQKAQFRLTGQDHNGLRSEAMAKIRTFTEDRVLSLFNARQKSFLRDLLHFDFHKTTPAESAKDSAMMGEVASLARMNPKIKFELMPSNGPSNNDNPVDDRQTIDELGLGADDTEELRALAAMPIVLRMDGTRPMPFMVPSRGQAGHNEEIMKNEWADRTEEDRRELMNVLRTPLKQGESRANQLTEWNKARKQRLNDMLASFLKVDKEQRKEYEEKGWLYDGKEGGYKKRNVITNIIQQEDNTPSGENSTAATEFSINLDLFQGTQSNITEIILPYIFDIMNLTTHSSITTALATSIFTDITASVDHAIGPFMYGFDCLDWLETQMTNATSADELSDDELVQMAIHEFLAELYASVWTNATAQMKATGLLDQSMTLARYVTPDDLSMAPSLFTSVGGTQPAANATKMEMIGSNGTIVNWKRTIELEESWGLFD